MVQGMSNDFMPQGVANPRRSRARLIDVLTPHGRGRTLHLTWLAFFFTFAVWFDFAPFAVTIGHQLHLSAAQLATLALANLALTVPARMLIGMLLDRFGPRRVFAGVLIGALIPNTMFALGTSFAMLFISRLLLSVVGAGFVVGIRMVAEWFPAEETGTAEGIYGGWGNMGAGVATLGLPLLAAAVGGPAGWRWAIIATGVVAALYGVVYLVVARDTPRGSTYLRPSRHGALQMGRRRSVFGLMALTLPIWGALGLVAWRVELVHTLSTTGLAAVLALVAVALLLSVRKIVLVNGPALARRTEHVDPFPFRAVVVLCLAYMVTFGAELAVSSMLPAFFAKGWHLGAIAAGATAGGFGLMNLVSRPSGGLLADGATTRRMVLLRLLFGSALGMALMSFVNGTWPLAAAVIAVVVAALFLQAGNGAVFSMVPLLTRSAGGQVAGMAGAYGNLGGVAFLSVLLVVPPQIFFLVIAATAAIVALIAWSALPNIGSVAQMQAAPEAHVLASVVPAGKGQA